MKQFILLLSLTLISCAQAQPNYRTELVKYEGYSEIPYHDRGGFSVGIGHHIYGEVKRSYSESEVEAFYQADLERNLKVCRAGVKDFEQLPVEAKHVCMGLAWGVGEQGFMNFAKFRAALSRRDYQTAANELEDSRWYHQVSHSRSYNYINTLKSL